jgi:hypothetical protein
VIDVAFRILHPHDLSTGQVVAMMLLAGRYRVLGIDDIGIVKLKDDFIGPNVARSKYPDTIDARSTDRDG